MLNGLCSTAEAIPDEEWLDSACMRWLYLLRVWACDKNQFPLALWAMQPQGCDILGFIG